MGRRGLGLIEVLISIVIMSIFIFTTQQALQYAQRGQASSQLGFDLMVGRNNIISVLSQAEVWNQTKLNNSGMDCLKNGTDCTGKGGPFDIYAYDGTSVTAYYSPVGNASYGLTKDGVQCTTFVAPGSTGNRNCPMRLELTWEPICPATPPCINPNVRVKGTFIVNTPEEGSAIKVDRLNFEMIQ